MRRLLWSTLFPYTTLFRSLTVRAPPVGLLVSGVTVKLALLVRLALLVAVTVWAPDAPTAAEQTSVLQAPYELVCWPPPDVKPLRVGKLSLRMPESLALVVA